jgi:RNA-directed DNA polymerase
MDVIAGGLVKIDIRRFFGSIDQSHFVAVLRLRVCDGALLRLIGKWVKAGMLGDGQCWRPEAGTPQGGFDRSPGGRILKPVQQLDR